MAKVETLRYGENPHQPAARYRRTDREPRAAEGPFATGEPPLQGKALSYNNVLDASAAAALARLLRGPAVVIVKHTNPCGAAERATLLEAWDAALAGDPVSAFGGVVARHGHGRPRARRAAGLDLPRGRRRARVRRRRAREVLATKPNLRLVVDRSLDASADRGGLTSRGLLDVDWLGSVRTAGGAVLVTAPDTPARRPGAPGRLSRGDRRRTPSVRDLDLAWRLCRGVVSNAIVLVRDGMLVGLGSGQVSRVDACRQAVDKARHVPGRATRPRGAVAASDAFFPFADGPEAPARRRRDGDRPARRLDARRRGARPPSTRPAPRCWSRGPATSATERRGPSADGA